MTTNTKPMIGTLIHGTLRSEDLFDAFANELERIAGKDAYESAVSDFPEDMSQILADDGERASEIVFALQDALNDYAPAHTYFGSIEGDGSDFGFWGDLESLEMCDTVATETPSYLRGDSEVWDKDCQVYVHINDHGNITVSDINHNEIWSAV